MSHSVPIPKRPGSTRRGALSDSGAWYAPQPKKGVLYKPYKDEPPIFESDPEDDDKFVDVKRPSGPDVESDEYVSGGEDASDDE